MRLLYSLAIIGAFLLVVVSCKKSSSPPSNAVTGNWTFVNMNAQTKVVAVVSGDSALSFANYITQNNAGTIDFTIDSMAVNSLAYTVNTTVLTYFLYYGIPYDTVTAPLTASVPPTSMKVAYKLVNQDSLYFPNGGLLPSGITSTSSGQGARFTISHDTLRMTVSAADTTTGQIQMGTAVITLVKQP